MASWGSQLSQLREILLANIVGALPDDSSIKWDLDAWNVQGDHSGPMEDPRQRYAKCWAEYVDEYQAGAGEGSPTTTQAEIWFELYWQKNTGQDGVLENAGFVHEVLSRARFAGYLFGDAARRTMGPEGAHYLVQYVIPFEHCEAWSSRPFISPTVSEAGTMASGSMTFYAPGHAFTVGAPVRNDGSGSWELAQADSEAHCADGVIVRVVGSFFTVAVVGFVVARAHGLGVAGSERWTSQVTPGATVTSKPVAGLAQRLLEVFDEDSLIVNVQKPAEVVA